MTKEDIKPRPPRRIDWYSVVIGAVVLSIALQFEWLNLEFWIQSTVTVGEVTKLNHGGFHPEITFTANEGQKISFPGSSAYPVEVGDRLEVRYIRSNPSLGPQVNQIWKLFDFMPSLAGIAFIVAGLLGKSILRFNKNDELPKKK